MNGRKTSTQTPNVPKLFAEANYYGKGNQGTRGRMFEDIKIAFKQIATAILVTFFGLPVLLFCYWWWMKYVFAPMVVIAERGTFWWING